MLSRRALGAEGNDGLGFSAGEPKQRPAPNFRRTVFGGFRLDEIMSQLEPIVRRAVGEEVDRAISLHNPLARPSSNLAGNSGRCNLQLRFVNKLPPTLYSGNPIEADDGTPLQIRLVNRATNETVEDGPLSSSKIELVVVSSEFGSDDEQDDWKVEEFNRSVVQEREGKRPLLTGEISMTLKRGVGILGNMVFTDNSSWNRSKKFRLGVRVVSRISTKTRVREAVSNSFSVKEHRGEKYKKHHPPSLYDEVWRLEQIRKDGIFHQRLNSWHLATVKDLLVLYEVDPSFLREILGPGVCNRIWDTIIHHANTCVVDDNKFYTYYFASENVVLMFNSVCKVVFAAFDSLKYLPVDSLTSQQKLLVQILKTQAYKKIHEWLPFDATANCTLNLLQNEPSIDFSILHQGQQGIVPASNFQSASYNHEAVGSQQPEFYQSQEIMDPLQVFNMGGAGHVREEPGPNSQAATIGCLFQGDQSYPWLPGSSTCGAGQAFHVDFGPNSHSWSLASLYSEISTLKPKAAWAKISAIVKWSSVRHRVAKRKRSS